MTIENEWCTLKVDNGSMHALMCLNAPLWEGELNISAEIILDFLHSQGITFGLCDAAIYALAEHVQYGVYMCVAKGFPAERGQDGYFEFLKNTEDMKKQPLLNEDGSVDYNGAFNIATVSEGELIARYHSATEGTEGKDIYGNTLPALAKGKELVPLRGKGIRVSEDKKEFFAQYSGHIVKSGNHISIDKLYRVSSDLDMEIGNIIFDGDVEVMGDVRSGMKIDAKGSIFIHGHVGACKIYAGENITIEKGIQGRDDCEIRAKGDITCKFVERCNIYAEGNVSADSVLNAHVVAQKQVNITSRTGTAVGCEIYGMAGVIVKEAGNDAGTMTLLRAGLPREEYVRAGMLRNKVKEIDGKLEEFNMHLEDIESDSRIPAEKVVETRTQIMRAKIVLTSNKNEYTDELSMLEERIREDRKNSFVTVTGTVFSGARIYIGDKPLIVTKAFKEVTFRLQGEEIIMAGMDEN